MPIDAGAEKFIAMSRASGRLPIETMEPKAAREAVRAAAPLLGGAPAAMSEVAMLAAGTPEMPIPLKLYRPETRAHDRVAPALLFLHGGGWLLGCLETHDSLCRAIARDADCVVIAVDYRLAPEHPFPAALEDAEAALTWVVDHAQTLGIDSECLGVGGDSAGGNLAAVLALRARDGDLPALAFQILLYPVCDIGAEHASYERNGNNYLLTRESMRYFIAQYAGHSEAIRQDWRASPLRADTLSDVAPAFLLTAGYDPLCDEGDAYAARLHEAGVEIEHVREAGQIHGFLTVTAIITEGEAVIRRIGAFIRSRGHVAARIRANGEQHWTSAR